MRVLIADKSGLIVQRLEELLSEIIFIMGTYKASSYEEACVLFNSHRPDVVVMDTNLPESCRLLKEIKESAPKTIVIMMFMDADEYITMQFKKTGADYFFDKYHEFEKIPAVINEIAANS